MNTAIKIVFKMIAKEKELISMKIIKIIEIKKQSLINSKN